MNGAEPGKPRRCPRGPKSTTVNLFQVDPCWYERYWWNDPAPRRRNAFASFHRILSDCPKWWVHFREALAACSLKLGPLLRTEHRSSRQ